MNTESSNGVTQEIVRGLFTYDPTLPVCPLVRVVQKTGIRPSQTPGRSRYNNMSIKGKLYPVSRLVWIYHFGEIPEGMQIDHIDRNRHNNVIGNLRTVTASTNMRNRRILGKTSKYRGVSWDSTIRAWRVTLVHPGRNIYVGLSSTEEQAAAMYDAAVELLHPNDTTFRTNRGDGLIGVSVPVYTLPDKVRNRILKLTI